jgi:hypothetical protein
MTPRFDRLYKQIMAELGQPVVDLPPDVNLKVATLPIHEYLVHIYFHDAGVSTLLREAQHRGTPIGGIYSAVKHSPHTPEGKHHLHLYAKGNQIGALNIDGTTHDSWHGHRLPNMVVNGIRTHFPSFHVPEDGVLETVSPEVADFILLLEQFK